MSIFGKNNNNNIIINGVRIQANGKNIRVQNNSVYVDGKLVEEGLTGTVEIRFEGDLASLKTDGSAKINGNVEGYVDTGGSCKCGDVGGYVDAGGSVTCGKVDGDVHAGGSIKMVR